MDDDFNTADATAVLFDLATQVNRSHSAREAGLLKLLGGLLGLIQREPMQFLQSGASAGELNADQIEEKIAQRVAARKARNFAEADRIRDELLKAGVILEDGAGVTKWRRA
jgi:cysteinyl-tRNA synthetase